MKIFFAIAMILLGCSESSKDVPKILIIGDSISSGYFPLVQKNLIGKAKVFQPTYSEKNGKIKGCCGGTSQGVKEIEIFLSDTKWDIIHFNFGLHDIKHIDPVTGKNSNFLGHFLHGLKLKSYNFNKYKTKKETRIISINILGIKNRPSTNMQLKFQALEEGTFYARDLVS